MLETIPKIVLMKANSRPPTSTSGSGSASVQLGCL